MKITSLEDLDWESVSHNPRIRKKTFIRKDEIPDLTVFAQAVFPPGEKAGEHVHLDMAEIFLALSGRGTIRLEGRTMEFGAGSCAVAEPGERHELENTGTEPLVVVFLGLQTANENL